MTTTTTPHAVGSREECLEARRALLADGFEGVRVHLENHDVAFTAVSRPVEIDPAGLPGGGHDEYSGA